MLLNYAPDDVCRRALYRAIVFRWDDGFAPWIGSSIRGGRLNCLSVNIVSMPDLEDRYLATSIVDQIDDPVASLPHPIAVGVPGKLLRAWGTRIGGKSQNPLDDTLAKSLGVGCLEFLFR